MRIKYSLSTHPKYDQIERRVPANLSGIVVNGVDLGQWVRGTSNTAFNTNVVY